VSLIQSSYVIIGEDLLNGSKIMKMLSQNWLYLGKRLGIMMKLINVTFYETRKVCRFYDEFFTLITYYRSQFALAILLDTR
jgi:hypothetical protein